MEQTIEMIWTGSGSGYFLRLNGDTLCSRPHGTVGDPTPTGHAIVGLLKAMGVEYTSKNVRGFGHVEIVASLDYDQATLIAGLYHTGFNAS
jgi:hypothetical protein